MTRQKRKRGMAEETLTKPANLLPRLRRGLADSVGEALEVVLRLAEEEGRTLYLVGGGVRDVVLRRGHVDIDLVGEGPMASLAEKAALVLGGRWVEHRAFGTVTVEGQDFRLDLAMARAEKYARPGALPKVRPASIDEDLDRRDFTINAMALALCGRERGRLLDRFDGMGDIAGGRVRVLHDRSFIDDATRILRAVRYETRFGFGIEEKTLALLKRDLAYLDTISGARVRHEFLRLLAEDEPEQSLLRCQELGVLAAIHGALRFDDELAAAFRRTRRAGRAAPQPEVHLALLGTRLSPADAEAVALRLALSKRQRQALEGAAALAELVSWLSRADARPSQVVERLESYPLAAVEACGLLAQQSTAKRMLRRYLGKWRYVKTSLDGRALARLGVARGPAMKDVLRLLKAARLDGQASSREEEMKLVRGVLEGTVELPRTGGGEG
ncbi:MAG: CCA tRNA nucleotidyltransferase [Dehalococcoidia bacterium]|nr:MAG: CCA tRNA nucleotidyltransferase [Dehalococcoidia bacterium]